MTASINASMKIKYSTWKVIQVYIQSVTGFQSVSLVQDLFFILSLKRNPGLFAFVRIDGGGGFDTAPDNIEG